MGPKSIESSGIQLQTQMRNLIDCTAPGTMHGNGIKAPCTPDATREAKQIRTRKSYCGNRIVYTAGNKQCTMQQATKWDLAPFFRVTSHVTSSVHGASTSDTEENTFKTKEDRNTALITSTLNVTREAKQIRTRKSCCSNRTVHTAR